MKSLAHEPLPADAVPAHPQAAPGRPKVVFIHVPKSGGTTLDTIFRDHFFDTPLYPPVGPNKLGGVLDQLRDPRNRYVGGHYPVGTVPLDAFDRKVTIVRSPLDVICSRLSFKNKLANAPPEALSPLELAGATLRIYEKYFSPCFEVERCKSDARQGVFQGLGSYVPTCAFQEVVDQVYAFDDVLDFARLDEGIKCFLIENGYFPYRSIQKKRAYAYEPDYERARKLLSEFDERFYAAARERFRTIPSDVELRYEQYRADYCRTRGLSLQVHEERRLDLRGPIGSSWFNVETSEEGKPFRWSEDRHATVEIPVAQAGIYDVTLSVTASAVDDVLLTACTTLEPRAFPVTESRTAGAQVFTAQVVTRAHDWIHLAFDLQRSAATTAVPQEGDVRALGVVLGDVRVARRPA
jgi:hypothetical protein